MMNYCCHVIAPTFHNGVMMTSRYYHVTSCSFSLRDANCQHSGTATRLNGFNIWTYFRPDYRREDVVGCRTIWNQYLPSAKDGPVTVRIEQKTVRR